MGEQRRRQLAAVPAAGAGGAYTRAISDRTASRLLERYGLAEGARQVAAQAAAAAQALEQRYRESLDEVAEPPAGATIHVDFRARTITVTPAPSASAD